MGRLVGSTNHLSCLESRQQLSLRVVFIPNNPQAYSRTLDYHGPQQSLNSIWAVPRYLGLDLFLFVLLFIIAVGLTMIDLPRTQFGINGKMLIKKTLLTLVLLKDLIMESCHHRLWFWNLPQSVQLGQKTFGRLRMKRNKAQHVKRHWSKKLHRDRVCTIAFQQMSGVI